MNAIIAHIRHKKKLATIHKELVTDQRLLDLTKKKKIQGPSPLHIAVESEYKEAVKLLLDLGSNVNIVDSTGATPLHYISLEHIVNLDIMKLLLQNGADPNVQDKDGDTALLSISKRYIPLIPIPGSEKYLKLLLDHGAHPGRRDKRGYTALHYIVQRPVSCALVKILVDRGAPINVKTPNGSTVLNIACFYADSNAMKDDDSDTSKTMKFLLKRGAKLHMNGFEYEACTRKILLMRLDLSDPNTWGMFTTFVRGKIREAKGSIKILAELLGTLLVHQDGKVSSISRIVKLFRDAGVFSVRQQVKFNSYTDNMSVVDVLAGYHYRYHIGPPIPCKYFGNEKIRLTDAMHPFHILVTLETDTCLSFNTPKRLATIVDYLLSKGYDINETVSGETAIHLLERRMYPNWSSVMIKKQNLHTIMVSRGAKTSTGRASQRKRPGETGKKMKNFIRKWTTYAYKDIQNSRRGKIIPKNDNSERINRYISQYMRNTGIRAPIIPREFTQKRPKYLYRGVHGKQAMQYAKNGKFKDTGFIAFSRYKHIASRFASPYPSLVMRLHVDSIPHGTPWLWFKTSMNLPVPRYAIPKGLREAYISSIDEGEVLLPPGTIILKPLAIPLNQMSEDVGENHLVVVDVEYIPNKTTLSLKKHRLYRSDVPTARTRAIKEAEEKDATTWFSTLFNSSSKKRHTSTTSNGRERKKQRR
jgi:hypothetical protein